MTKPGPTTCWGLVATVGQAYLGLTVHCERLTFYHNGIQRRLTNVHGNVLTELLA